MIAELVVSLGSICFLYMIYTYYKFKDMPPGPYGLPFVGYSLFLGQKPHVTLKNLSLKYGSMFSVNLANSAVVVVNDWKTIHDVLVTKASSFNQRVVLFTSAFLKKEDRAYYEQELWDNRKCLMIRLLREFNLGTDSFERVFMNTVKEMMRKLERENGNAVELPYLFSLSSLNAILEIATGKQFGLSDKESISLEEALATNDKLFKSTSIMNFMPFLRHVAPDMTGFSKLQSARDQVTDYVTKEVHLRWDNPDENDTKDIISRYIIEIKQRCNGAPDAECSPYDRKSLHYSIHDFIEAGTETVGALLSWAFLYIGLWPNVQHKLQQELDSVIGKDFYLPYSSKERAPYTMATVLEIQRLSSVAAFTEPHGTSKDISIKGHRIRKGTTIMINLWGLHNDQNIWGDPHDFRPERFLADNGKVKRPEYLIPFGAGPSVCIGKSMVEVQLFLFVSTLVHHFSFETVPGKPKPTLEPPAGTSLHPADYSLIVKLRK